MSPLSLILNILWLLTGGIWMAAGWLLAALIMAMRVAPGRVRVTLTR